MIPDGRLERILDALEWRNGAKLWPIEAPLGLGAGGAQPQ